MIELGKEGHPPTSGPPNSSLDSSLTWNTILALARHFTALTILRATLRPFLCNESGTMDEGPDEEFENRLLARINMETCIKDFSQFIRDIKPEESTGLWPPWCQTAFSALCFTSLMLIVSSTSQSNATQLIQNLQATRKRLRLKANSLAVLRLALLRIDSIFWRGPEQVIELPIHVKAAFEELRAPR